VSSVFSEPDDFEAAMRADGGVSLVTTEPGQFRARITQVALNGMRLLDVNENVPRIAFIKIPEDTLLVALSLSRWPDWFWNGQEVQAGELATLGPGETAHVRTNGQIHWCAVSLACNEFARLSRALIGKPIDLRSELRRWRPPPAALRELTGLHQIAIKAIQADTHPIGAVDAAHGLEQQVIQAVTECLASGSRLPPIPVSPQPQDLMSRLEALLADDSTANMDTTALSGALGVSDRLLRQRCADTLGMSLNRYLWVRRMHAVRLALSRAPKGDVRIREVAQSFGFHSPGRFAGAYRSLFGERPSVTLRQGPPRVLRPRARRERGPERLS
jgi:AraC-like DNA-binding protein